MKFNDIFLVIYEIAVYNLRHNLENIFLVTTLRIGKGAGFGEYDGKGYA